MAFRTGKYSDTLHSSLPVSNSHAPVDSRTITSSSFLGVFLERCVFIAVFASGARLVQVPYSGKFLKDLFSKILKITNHF